MIKVLELFCGTKSIGKCCDELGWESISVDLEPKFNPTHLCNIMDFDYKQYPKDYFDLIVIDECHRGGANDEGNWRLHRDIFNSSMPALS